MGGSVWAACDFGGTGRGGITWQEAIVGERETRKARAAMLIPNSAGSSADRGELSWSISAATEAEDKPSSELKIIDGAASID